MEVFTYHHQLRFRCLRVTTKNWVICLRFLLRERAFSHRVLGRKGLPDVLVVRDSLFEGRPRRAKSSPPRVSVAIVSKPREGERLVAGARASTERNETSIGACAPCDKRGDRCGDTAKGIRLRMSIWHGRPGSSRTWLYQRGLYRVGLRSEQWRFDPDLHSY